MKKSNRVCLELFFSVIYVRKICAFIFLVFFCGYLFAEEGICKRVIGSQCDASQEAMLDALLRDMDVYGYVKKRLDADGMAPAFESLPKDQFGLVNWTKRRLMGL